MQLSKGSDASAPPGPRAHNHTVRAPDPERQNGKALAGAFSAVCGRGVSTFLEHVKPNAYALCFRSLRVCAI